MPGIRKLAAEPAGGGGALIRPGLYARGYGTASNSLMEAGANNRTYLSFLQIGSRVSIDRISVNVTVAGEAAGTARLGIYGPFDIAENLPLLLDAGTVAIDSTGLKEITIDQELTPGWYALACRFEGVPTTRPTMTVINSTTTGGGASGAVWNPSTAATNVYAGSNNLAGTGAFGATYTVGTGVSSAVPAVFVRFAA